MELFYNFRPVAKSSASSTNNLPDVISISSDKNSTDYKDLSSVSHDTDDIITISDDDEGNKEVSGTAKQTTYDWEALSSKETKTSSVGLSIDALIEASEKLEAFAMDPIEDNKLNVVGKPSLDGSVVSHLDFSLLTGVSESVLDISHGSSLSSPAVDRNDSSLGLLAMAALYEDISCDGDHMFDTSEKQPKAEDNLHMSVDETDHMILGLDQDVGRSDATQPMFYKSCLSEFSNSVYNTANNTGDLAVCKQPSSSFSDYRDTFDDSCDLEGVNSVNFKYEANDNIKETSFEMVMNNRQNSFASTVATVTKTENTMEKTKPFISKLPVYNCTSNMLKPSLLQGNLDSKLKARNFKWAKTLPKPCQTEPKNTNSEIKPKKTIVKTSTEKVINSEQPKQKTPAKSLSIQKLIITKTPSKCGIGPLTSNNSKTPRKALVNELIPKSTFTNKTTDKRALSQPTKLPKSAAKTPKCIRPPINHLLSSGKLNENKNLVPDRYKNVISPIRAYINNSPLAIQRKAHVPEKQIFVLDHSARKVESHIPKSMSTPFRGLSSKTSSATKVAPKLFKNKVRYYYLCIINEVKVILINTIFKPVNLFDQNILVKLYVAGSKIFLNCFWSSVF